MKAVKAAWSEVVNQYQRRADLIPNLVATVKGFAAQEERVLVGVTEARAKATSIQLTPELINDPAAFAKFQAAQGELTQALKSLLVDGRELSGSQVRRELPRPAGAARGHGEPHHRRAQPLHRGGAALQRDGARVPDATSPPDVRLRGEAELHGRERSGDLHGAHGGLRHLDAGAVGNAGRSRRPRPRRPPPRTESRHESRAARARVRCWRGRRAAGASAQIPLPKFEARSPISPAR